MDNIQYHMDLLPLGDGISSAMHRFSSPMSKTPVLLLHGSIESGRIFFSKNGKGLAPFLAERGFDVFVPDQAGKGESVPAISRGFKHSQADVIERDIPIYLNYIRKFHPQGQIRLGGHSWGGVQLLAWYARFGEIQDVGPAVFFGTKRHISIISLRRIFMLDVMWTLVGKTAMHLKGYVPALALSLGGENEPKDLFNDVTRWVYAPRWKDKETGYDYAKALQVKKIPPILYFAGIADYVLGHPKDVERLHKETGADNAEVVLLSKRTGHARDYGHIDMLTGKTCPDDHFPLAEQWLLDGSFSKV